MKRAFSQSSLRYSALYFMSSLLLVVAEALLAAFFIQSFLTRWGYDAFWSKGFLIVAFSCALSFLTVWFFFSELAANLSGLPLRQTLPRHSSIFLPVTILFAYRFMPAYHRQNIAAYFLVTAISLTFIIVAYLLYESWKQSDNIRVGRLVNLRTVFSFFCAAAVVAASFRFHNSYLLGLLVSDISRASCTDASTGIDVSMPVRVLQMPARFAWEASVPENGVFQVALVPNENLRRMDVEIPIHYHIRMRLSDGEYRTISEGDFDSRKVTTVRDDLSNLAGGTVTVEFKMKESFSLGSMFGSLHMLLRPYLWAPAMSDKARAIIIPAYWSEPMIYSPRKSAESNVLFIIVDTLRADHMGCYGYEWNTSPNLDQLAGEGVLFKQAISQAPWTLPSVASIYTGRLPTSHLAGMKKGNSQAKLTRQPNFVELLRENGFYTAGLATNAYLSKDFGMDQSFDAHYYRYKVDAEHVSDLFCQWLDENADKKFFFLLHYFDPHQPYEMKQDFLPLAGNPAYRSQEQELERYRGDCTKGQTRVVTAYDSEIAFADAQIERVFAKLRELGLFENTLIVFVSDHGEEFREHGGIDHGHSLYDELLHVPLIFRFPSRLPKGKRIGAQVRLVDILPTVFDVVGMDFDTVNSSGTSLLSLMVGQTTESRDAVSEFLIRGSERKGIRSGRYKLIFSPDGGEIELYDILADPCETANLAESMPEIRDTLMSKLRAELDQNAALYMGEAEFPVLDEETRKSLKALGYID